MPARKLDFYFSSTEPLRNLAQAARQLDDLQKIFANIAPSALAQACCVKQFSAGVLCLLANNAAVATQLKQLSPRLLAGYQKQGRQVTSIRIEVQVTNSAPRAATQAEKKALSLDSIKNIKDLAEQLEASPLKEALLRLAGRRDAGP